MENKKKKEKKKPKFLYKYMTFEQLVDLIENERLYLTRINLWEDTHEGYPIKDFYEYFNKDKKHISDERVNGLVELARKTSYAQSWTYSRIESDALWRIYSQQKTGVKIKVKTDDIEKCLINSFLVDEEEERIFDNILGGHIYYYGLRINFEDYRVGNGHIFETSKVPFLFRKRESFKHEAEYRFATKLNRLKVYKAIGKHEDDNEYKQKVDEYNSSPVIYYMVPNNIIKEIILDPRSAGYFEETFMRYCQNRKLNENGTIFKKSELYKLL